MVTINRTQRVPANQYMAAIVIENSSPIDVVFHGIGNQIKLSIPVNRTNVVLNIPKSESILTPKVNVITGINFSLIQKHYRATPNLKRNLAIKSSKINVSLPHFINDTHP